MTGLRFGHGSNHVIPNSLPALAGFARLQLGVRCSSGATSPARARLAGVRLAGAGLSRPLSQLVWGLLFAVTTVTFVGGCTKVSGTGRTQFNFMSRDQELSLGEGAYKEELSSAKLVTSGEQYAMVKRVTERVSAAATRLHPDATKGFSWEFRLVDAPEMVNAWALPGGKMAVYTGLFKAVKNEAQLAAVMGHECSHAIARHSGERMSQQSAAQVLLAGAGIGASYAELSPAAQEATMAAFGAGAQYGILLPFSRHQESEADELGLLIAADAGYDPREAVELWKNMASLGGEKPPEWASTHPADETRQKRLSDLMPKALELWKKRGGKP
jgi:predicted Zn-dependent protease